MKYTFFRVMALSPEADGAALNAFLAQGSVIGIERQFVQDGAGSFWSICVVTTEGVDAGGAKPRRRGVDYRDLLSPEHFARFARLRTLRNRLAEEQATPAYAIFTNEQLSATAQLENPSMEAMARIDAVIDPYQAAHFRGLPIGALTSQHFANHYLNEADRWCLARPGIRAHCRYMDDFLLWADDRQTLRSVRDAFADWVSERLGLHFRSTLIQRSTHGLRFLGIHLRPYSLRPSQHRRRRYRGAIQRWQAAWRRGEIDDHQLQAAYASAQSILLPADDSTWRRRCLAQLGVVDA